MLGLEEIGKMKHKQWTKKDKVGTKFGKIIEKTEIWKETDKNRQKTTYMD